MPAMSKNEMPCTQMKYIVSIGSGLTSFEALRRTIKQKGRENTITENGR